MLRCHSLLGCLACFPIRNRSVETSYLHVSPCLSWPAWPHAPQAVPHARLLLTVPFCLADCLLHEENFSVRCPKHKVSQSLQSLCSPQDLGVAAGLLLKDLETRHCRVTATPPGPRLPGCWAAEHSWPRKGRDAHGREPRGVGSAPMGWRSWGERCLSVKKNWKRNTHNSWFPPQLSETPDHRLA